MSLASLPCAGCGTLNAAGVEVCVQCGRLLSTAESQGCDVAVRQTSRATPKILSAALIIITLVVFMDQVDDNALFGVLPLIGKEFNLDDFQLGLIPFVESVLLLLATIPFGLAADRFSRTRVVTIGLLVWAVFTALSGLAVSFPMLLVIRGCTGVGVTSYDAPTSSLVCDLYPSKLRGKALGFRGLGITLGAVLGVGLAGAATAFVSWRLVFLVVGVLALPLAFFMFRLREPTRGQFDDTLAEAVEKVTLRHVWDGARQILGSPGMRLGILGLGIQTFGVDGIGTFLPTFLERYYGISNASAAGIFALVIVGSVIGVYPGGLVDSRLTQRYGTGSHFLVAGLCTFAMGICFAIGIYVPLLPLTVGLSVLSGFLLGATLAPLGALVGDVIRANRRSYAYATQTTVAKLIGVSAAPLLGGLSVALGNLQLAMILFVIPLLLAGLLLFSRQKAVSQGTPVSTVQP